MGPEERDWVDVANGLLLKCHINLILERITDCNANVFVSLYEAILGEKVPDYVAAKRQEDDIHNVQSVIDSLALDYLQISLSHITGENIVRGDRESIRNLLEIFEGLLEYLTEQLSDEEEPQIAGLSKETLGSAAAPQFENQDSQSSASSIHSAVQSSKNSLRSWNGNESASTTELIHLGDSARTFTAKQEVLAVYQVSLLREPLHTAIPLQPPYQTTTQRPFQSAYTSPLHREQPVQDPQHTQPEVGQSSDRFETNGESSFPVSLNSPEGEKRVQSDVLEDQVKVDVVVPRRVQSQQLDETEKKNKHRAKKEEERKEEPSNCSDSQSGLCAVHNDSRPAAAGLMGHDGTVGSVSLLMRSQRNKETEQELHDMSEKLSRRLEDLDLMLKRALGEAGETSEPREEEKRSHLSNNIMECIYNLKPTGPSHSSTRSLSPSPLPAQSHRQDALISHRDNLYRRSQLASSYAGEHQKPEEQETLNAHTTYEYQAVCREAPTVQRSSSKSSYARSFRTKHQQTARQHTHKTAPMRVKETDLLSVLLEECPQLQISPHTLTHMWKQQFRQITQLNRSRGTPSKLSQQLEEAQKRHNLLVQIIRREQEHNRRLREFRERIQQQKSAQNKLREQRQQVTRAKKYYSDYHVQLRSRLMRTKTQEEKMLRQTFEEGLELQKAHLREQHVHAKGLREEHKRKHRDDIQAMENYYRDQFSLLAETLAQERQNIQVRKQAQEKALQKIKRELRNKMEKEMGELQRMIIQNDEDDYFRDLEVERLRKRVHMASFQYYTSCLH